MNGTAGRLPGIAVAPGRGVAVLISIGLALCASCDIGLNPAFLNTIGVPASGPSSAGHVAVVFRNDTRFDDDLLTYLAAAGVDRELLSTPDLRPRIRFTVRVTFVNGEQLDVEFRDGATIVDPRVDPTTLPDLTRDELTNIVVQCDVARVEVIESTISLFVPVFFETTRIDPGDENTPPFRVRVDVVPPRFVVLQRDDVDQQGNVVLQRNFDIRDTPAPADPLCGSVVALSLAGTLRVPFETNATGEFVPGVLNTNTAEEAESPGRYQFRVSIR